MNQYLHEKGIQFKQGKKIWLLYKEYAEMGLTINENTYFMEVRRKHSSKTAYLSTFPKETYYINNLKRHIYDDRKRGAIE